MVQYGIGNCLPLYMGQPNARLVMCLEKRQDIRSRRSFDITSRTRTGITTTLKIVKLHQTAVMDTTRQRTIRLVFANPTLNYQSSAAPAEENFILFCGSRIISVGSDVIDQLWSMTSRVSGNLYTTITEMRRGLCPFETIKQDVNELVLSPGSDITSIWHRMA
nr:hypothetical protein Iba_chr02eCG8300 [Ipomoea batatas]